MPAKKSDPIVQDDTKNDAVLHTVADLVPLPEIPSKKIQDIIATMHTVLGKEEDGVGLAAPQIGVSLRIFIVKGSVLAKENETLEDMVFINPVITKQSREAEWTDEGCLSVRNWFGKVKRSTKATVRAYDQNGKLVVRGASGLLAQIFQHEIDHLNGVLFTEHATDLIEFRPEKKK